MKINTSELSGEALDWAVGMACGIHVGNHHGIPYRKDMPGDTYGPGPAWKPSIDWSQGGPLIERFSVTIGKRTDCPPGPRQWDAFIDTKFCKTATYANFGHAPLIAACRAIVSAKLGGEVDVPEGLV